MGENNNNDSICLPPLEQESASSRKNNNNKHSQIISLRSQNLGGLATVTTSQDNEVGGTGGAVTFGKGQNLIAITGETGSGKSVLWARAIEILMGGKVAASLVGSTVNLSANQGDQMAFVEMDMLLCEPHASFARWAMDNFGLDPMTTSTSENGENSMDDDSSLVLRLKRTLLLQPSLGNKARLKSLCEINGQTVTLKILSVIARPLLAVVDASAASAALSRPEARLAILDTAVTPMSRQRLEDARKIYRKCRIRREQLEKELASRALSRSSSYSSAGEKNVELLQHWIDELDAFESRIGRLCQTVSSGSAGSGSSELSVACDELANAEWMDNTAPKNRPFASSMYEKLTRLRNVLVSLDRQIESARAAYDSLASLSSSQSAATAIERTRALLFDAGRRSSGDIFIGKVEQTVERSHDLLNQVEVALMACASYLEDENQGLIGTLELERSGCELSVEQLDVVLLDWNTLARKHGISPFSLPSCHASLRLELSGGVEAKARLPKAITDEETALVVFQNTCKALSLERNEIAQRLANSVNSKLPSLGMDKSEFRAHVDSKTKDCTSSSVYYSSGASGVDSVDFILIHAGKQTGEDSRRGLVHQVASSGEKARLLLALECALPGSVGAACRSNSDLEDLFEQGSSLPPVAVIYDEIDAHVGGNAAVALADMLADQSQFSQVIAITHSPSVAAIADAHVVVSKLSNTLDTDQSNVVKVKVAVADDEGKRQELARMASGDLASEEARVFADALIRDGTRRRQSM